MLGEIICEAVALAALLVVAYVFGRKKVRLIDRQYLNESDYVIAPPRRDKIYTEAARNLNAKYRKHNQMARTETESLIALPSTSICGFFAFIEGAIFTVLVGFNHFRGISQFMIGERIYDEERLFTGDVGALIVLMIIAIAVSFMFDKVIMESAKTRADEIGRSRARKGRTVRFVQCYSVDELAGRIKWAIVDSIEQGKIERAQKKRKKIASKQQPVYRGNVIQLPKCANH